MPGSEAGGIDSSGDKDPSTVLMAARDCWLQFLSSCLTS